jgi:aminopeptidase N
MILKMKVIFLVEALFISAILHAQPPDSIWQRSLRKFEQKNYHGVIEDMNALLKELPDLSDAFYNRGVAKYNLGDVDDACTDMQLAEAKGLDKNNPFINYLCNKKFTANLLLKQFYKNQTVNPALGYRPSYTRADSLRGSLRPERTCFDVYFYDLRVKIIPKGKKIEGRNNIYFHIKKPSRVIQIDLFDNYRINSIVWNGNKLRYKREYNALFIEFPQILQVGEDHIISLTYKGKPPVAPNPPWDGGFVWDRDENNDLWLGVACEHLGASSWWPNKDHLSDKPDSMLINLQIPKDYQAVSNGNLREIINLDQNYNEFKWFVSYPINNYNVTFYVGKYVSFSDTLISGKDTVRFDYNVLNYNLDKAKEHFKQTLDIIAFYNRAFGIYPFQRDGLALVESPYEGMEHQSAIAYGNKYDNANANAYRNQKYDFIIVHEVAHEWWGNSVTAADMADIWIHEGFATYAEYMFIEDKFGKDEYLYELTDKSGYIFNFWPMVQNRNVNENSLAGNDVYNKGAMMLHCLRCCISNDSLFFNIIRDFCIQNRYGTVTSDDFIRFVNQKTNSDYTPFFRKYLYDTQLPVLSYEYTHEDDNLVIKYRWIGVENGFFMPLCIETDDKESIRLVATTNWQEIIIPGAKWFNFYNLQKGYEGSIDNSFTYFHTDCMNY